MTKRRPGKPKSNAEILCERLVGRRVDAGLLSARETAEALAQVGNLIDALRAGVATPRQQMAAADALEGLSHKRRGRPAMIARPEEYQGLGRTIDSAAAQIWLRSECTKSIPKCVAEAIIECNKTAQIDGQSPSLETTKTYYKRYIKINRINNMSFAKEIAKRMSARDECQRPLDFILNERSGNQYFAFIDHLKFSRGERAIKRAKKRGR